MTALFALDGETIDLRTQYTQYRFGRPATEGVVSVAQGAPPPVLRLKRGRPTTINLTNGLDAYTTMHWHGLRVPNAMDGVPYLTQYPIEPGDMFRYRFASQDAGTFWYHPHCRTMEQMAHGLTGILVVEEDDDPGFDVDLPVNLKAFRLNDDGTFLPYFTPRGAARGGTNGNVRTANWAIEPTFDVPAGGLVRLRIAVTDTTRVYRLALPDLPGEIIAWNGHPVREAIAWPTIDAPLWLSPGERIDVALRMGDEEGTLTPIKGLIGRRPMDLFSLRTVGASARRDLAELTPLPKNPVPVPDLQNAATREFVFGWTPEGDGARNGFCGDYPYTFWSIDRDPWPGDAVEGIPPLATFERGKSYVVRLRNSSPNMHPIHLHGLVFRPIRSNMRVLPSNDTDTILLLKDEIVDIAFVADNPGDWAFHCHVIEHQKTGLAGYVRVV